MPAVYIIIFHFRVVLHPFSAGTDFMRQILTSKVDPRTERVKYV